VGLGTSSSDIDFVIYGYKQFNIARSIIKNSDEIESLDREEWMKYYKSRFPGIPSLDFKPFLWHEKRKMNIGKIGGAIFNLLLVDDKVKIYRGNPIKRVRIKCRVLNSEQAFSLPSSYLVDHPVVGRIVSFTHTYTGQALEGERIEVCGMLEELDNGEHQLVVGTSREAEGEFIRVLNSDD
jgi:predicted nucleotidyltransferase